MARVPPPCPRGLAPTARGWPDNNCAGVDVGQVASTADGTGGDESLSVWSARPSRENPYLSADKCEEIEESLATIRDRINAVQALRQQRYSRNDLFREVYMLPKYLRAHGRLDGGEHQRRAL